MSINELNTPFTMLLFIALMFLSLSVVTPWLAWHRDTHLIYPEDSILWNESTIGPNRTTASTNLLDPLPRGDYGGTTIYRVAVHADGNVAIILAWIARFFILMLLGFIIWLLILSKRTGFALSAIIPIILVSICQLLTWIVEPDDGIILVDIGESWHILRVDWLGPTFLFLSILLVTVVITLLLKSGDFTISLSST
ncbi:MAG: hypothetical protein GY805_22740 [Chloroflexi bacterium]|nr:hypothetical protein [Chloroflexota bacterium]